MPCSGACWCQASQQQRKYRRVHQRLFVFIIVVVVAPMSCCLCLWRARSTPPCSRVRRLTSVGVVVNSVCLRPSLYRQGECGCGCVVVFESSLSRHRVPLSTAWHGSLASLAISSQVRDSRVTCFRCVDSLPLASTTFSMLDPNDADAALAAIVIGRSTFVALYIDALSLIVCLAQFSIYCSMFACRCKAFSCLNRIVSIAKCGAIGANYQAYTFHALNNGNTMAMLAIDKKICK